MPNSYVLILGGAGFIGSNIAENFHQNGSHVIVIDGLLDHTGGRKENINNIISDIEFYESRVEKIDNLDELISKSDVIIDCMAWTAHHLALKDPLCDLQLNTASHLSLLKQLRKFPDKKIIYLGSRGQYGLVGSKSITENTPMVPEDIQGIHKLSAESYFRVYSKLYGLNVVSLRIPNCFGENQPLQGNDIGLIGSFVRDALKNRPIEVFGKARTRFAIYVKDLAEVVFQLSVRSFSGFNAFNFAGCEHQIAELAKKIIDIVGKGSLVQKEIPREVQAIDIGNAKFIDSKLNAFLGFIPTTDLSTALESTITYFKKMIHDLEM